MYDSVRGERSSWVDSEQSNDGLSGVDGSPAFEREPIWPRCVTPSLYIEVKRLQEGAPDNERGWEST